MRNYRYLKVLTSAVCCQTLYISWNVPVPAYTNNAKYSTSSQIRITSWMQAEINANFIVH